MEIYNSLLDDDETAFDIYNSLVSTVKTSISELEEVKWKVKLVKAMWWIYRNSGYFWKW